MINKYKVLALIPARGKSLELKNKNLKKFLKKPLVKWSYDAANKSKFIDKVIVSSDSKEILELGKKYKKFIISKRPRNLSTRHINMIDVINFELNKNSDYDILILLQPTSPLRSANDIDKCLKLMIKKQRLSAVSFTRLKYTPELMFRLSDNNKILNFKSIKQPLNRQNYEKYFYPSGDIYISFIKRLKKKKNFLDKKTLPFVISKYNSIDIDDILDFKLGELKLKLKK